MSSSNVGPAAPAAQLDSLSDASPVEARGADWLGDSVERARPRHAAITRNLHTISSYKNWAEQVRESWAEPEAGLQEAASKK